MAKINGKDLYEISKEIRKRYNYTEDFADELVTILSSVVDYHVDAIRESDMSASDIEKLIYDAFVSSEFKVAPFSNDVNNYKYRDGLIEANKIVILPSTFTIGHPAHESVLARMILKLIRSRDNRDGFIVNSEVQADKVNPGTGLEVGTIDYVVPKIMAYVEGGGGITVTNSEERPIVGNLMDGDGLHLESEMLCAGLTGDYSTLDEVFRDAGMSFEDFRRLVDNIYMLESERRMNIDNDEVYNKYSSMIETIMSNDVAPVMAGIRNVLEEKKNRKGII